MEVTRRTFGMMLAASLAALLAGVWRAGSAAARARWMAVVRRGGFPGRLRPMDWKKAGRPARWRG